LRGSPDGFAGYSGFKGVRDLQKARSRLWFGDEATAGAEDLQKALLRPSWSDAPAPRTSATTSRSCWWARTPPRPTHAAEASKDRASARSRHHPTGVLARIGPCGSNVTTITALAQAFVRDRLGGACACCTVPVADDLGDTMSEAAANGGGALAILGIRQPCNAMPKDDRSHDDAVEYLAGGSPGCR